jgi:uncharacterized membrane protein YcaP (DUF421 family)
MSEFLTLDTPLWEIAARGTAVYLGIAFLVRLIPKRHAGELSPNDLIAVIVVGSLGASAIVGDTEGTLEVLLMIGVVLLWDYLFNVLEYHVPGFRKIAQDSPTLLIHNGRILRKSLRREKLTDEELDASLRKQGITSTEQVRLAILEADGHISVVKEE